jgi:hypothetical protein
MSHHSSSYQNYLDYYKCINAKGEDFAPCKQFFRAYHSLCPSESLIDPLLLQCIALTCVWCQTHGYSPSIPQMLRRTHHAVNAQIEKFDEQREAGAFPASLEP